jgi:hypothetical protein
VADPDPPVEVELTIAARPEAIFRYFTDPARFARWMGQARCSRPSPAGGAAGALPVRRGRFRNPTAAVDGAGPLADHIGMVQRLAGGTRLELRGAPESCHGVVRFAWAALGPGRPSWPPAPTWPRPTWTGTSAG